jgi:hypothetical protein
MTNISTDGDECYVTQDEGFRSDGEKRSLPIK